MQWYDQKFDIINNIIITLFYCVDISTMSVISVFCLCNFIKLTFLLLFLESWSDMMQQNFLVCKILSCHLIETNVFSLFSRCLLQFFQKTKYKHLKRNFSCVSVCFQFKSVAPPAVWKHVLHPVFNQPPWNHGVWYSQKLAVMA